MSKKNMRDAIRRALNELGVPEGNYPAPVANAIAILEEAIRRPWMRDQHGNPLSLSEVYGPPNDTSQKERQWAPPFTGW